MLSVLRKRRGIIHGRVRCGKLTKQIVNQIQPGEIAVISHADIDEVTAHSLVSRRVRAVINCSPSFTGRYSTEGARLLLDNHVPLYDCSPCSDIISYLHNGQLITIDGHYLFNENGQKLSRLTLVTMSIWKEKHKIAEDNGQRLLEEFINNTLEHAIREKSYFINPLPELPLNTSLINRDAVVVARGNHYREDLQAIRAYIHEVNPVLIGVDGGADALLEFGLTPDIIIGDMDSVSDRALAAAKDIVVHAYPAGGAPGEQRVHGLGLPYHLLHAPGMSQDIALLLAYEYQSRCIVSLGTHSNMIEFLEKGRSGMASTLLVRMKIGTRLVDAKGISQLYPRRTAGKSILHMFGGIGFPAVIAAGFHPVFRNSLLAVWLHVKAIVGG
ncbi:putative cytokinetic ring protein SteA [Aneurinibacillus terranovensis]|uniref:putative cytokinetic ring protein SteA n=1 Tax=Aneurinibacillus terranovensis TaxID=278991 RepID=UPI0004171703|nr:putative cytokinetic ring protein SteA [Aneurinibacillus terranovensis]